MKRERLPIKRERFRAWKVFKHIEEPRAMLEAQKPLLYQACGSSIAHGKCVYAGQIASGHPLCDARQRVWKGCPFMATAQIAQAFVKLEEDAA